MRISFWLTSFFLYLTYYYPVLFGMAVTYHDGGFYVAYAPPALIFSVSVILIFLLLMHLFDGANKLIFFDKELNRLKIGMWFISMIVAFVLKIIEVGLDSFVADDKVLIMEKEGYLAKLNTGVAVLVFSVGCFYQSRFLMASAFAVGLIDVALGQRYIIFTQIVVWLIWKSLSREKLRLGMLLWLLVVAVFLLLTKLTAYWKNFEFVWMRTILNEIGSKIWVSTILNSESASISYFLIEVADKNFTLSASYLSDFIFSLVPFAPLIAEHRPVGFADLVKSNVLGDEALSFASGMPALMWSLFGSSSTGLVAISYVLLYKALKLGCRVRVLLPAIVASVAILIGFGLRSDLIYVVSLLRSVWIPMVFMFLFFKLISWSPAKRAEGGVNNQVQHP